MENNQSGRRSFINKVALGSLAAVSIPEIAFSAMLSEKSKNIKFATGDIILFQGDSITDAGRNRKSTSANDQGAMGGGYAFLAASDLLFRQPDKKFQIYNRGVGGNKVYQLADAWDKDALDLKPDVLSILVGVNDYWHTLSFGYKATIDTYKNDYKALLQRTKDKLPDVKLIIGEPFAILGTAVTSAWFPAFNEYQQAAKELAKEFNAVYVPYQKVFDKALQQAPGAYWSGDGVHPSIAGARLMAEAWLQAVK